MGDSVTEVVKALSRIYSETHSSLLLLHGSRKTRNTELRKTRVLTTPNSFMIQHHTLITAELYFLQRSTACQNCSLRNRQEHFSQQGGTADTCSFINLGKIYGEG